MPCRAGVPLRVVFTTQLSLQRLLAALLSIPVASVTLHDSLGALHSRTVSKVMSALATSSATLTALHGLALSVAQRDRRPQPGLAAFTRLRALTLHQTEERPEALRATHLPASLEELTLARQAAVDTDWRPSELPALVAFGGLSKLRRLTLAGFEYGWWIRGADDRAEEGRSHDTLFPHSLEVQSCVPRSARSSSSVLLAVWSKF